LALDGIVVLTGSSSRLGTLFDLFKRTGTLTGFCDAGCVFAECIDEDFGLFGSIRHGCGFLYVLNVENNPACPFV
jgi:hypothetical protein